MTGLEYGCLPLSNAAGFHEHVQSLTPSQNEFVRLLIDWYGGGREFGFAVVSGGPGCGKTHAVVKTLRFLKANVLKMAPTARLANRIGGRTVHSALGLAFREGSELHRVEEELRDSEDVEKCLRVSACLLREFSYRGDRRRGGGLAPDIVVLDELSMIPFWLVYQMALYFARLSQRSVLMVCMGDDCQLKAVASKTDVFRFPFENYFATTRIEMRESKRFTLRYERIVNRLRELMSSTEEERTDEEGTDPDIYEKDPFFVFIRREFPVKECVTKSMLRRASRVLAYKNETVNKCNDFYIKVKMRPEPLYELPSISGENPAVFLRKNCNVVVTENGCGENAFNGSCLKFLEYDANEDVAVCEDEEKCGLVVKVGRSAYTGKIPLVPGFATTVHKYQGETIDGKNNVMCFDGSSVKNLIYTGLSRVRDVKQILAVVLK